MLQIWLLYALSIIEHATDLTFVCTFDHWTWLEHFIYRIFYIVRLFATSFSNFINGFYPTKVLSCHSLHQTALSTTFNNRCDELFQKIMPNEMWQDILTWLYFFLLYALSFMEHFIYRIFHIVRLFATSFSNLSLASTKVLSFVAPNSTIYYLTLTIGVKNCSRKLWRMRCGMKEIDN